MPKRKVKETKAKKISLRCSLRDLRHDCQLGQPVRFGSIDYMVVITTNHEVGLINDKKNIKIIPWFIWKKRKKKAKNPNFFIWDKEVRRIIKFHSKQIAKRLKSIKRTPIIKRMPVKQ